MGRPLKEIDGDGVYRLAKLGCTQEDIAEYFDCAQSVISERFRLDFALGRQESKISLRRMQWKRARAGSDTILVHLGKVYLGQTDRLDITTQGDSVKTVLHFEDNGFGADPARESPGGSPEGVCPVEG